MAKISPNDSCPCGSGKKYKKCCQFKDEQQSRESQRIQRDDALEAALAQAKKTISPEGSPDRGSFYDFALPLLIQGTSQPGQSLESSILDLTTMIFNACLKRDPKERDAQFEALTNAFVKRRAERENMMGLATLLLRRFPKVFPRLVDPASAPPVQDPDGRMLPAPLSELLTIGQVSLEMVTIRYIDMGIGQSDIPELLRIIQSEAYWRAPSPINWAPLHAWRALSQLKAKDAISALLNVAKQRAESHIVQRDLPVCLGLMGQDALSGVQQLAQDSNLALDTRVIAIEAVGFLAKSNPELRGPCETFLRETLSRDESVKLNGAAAAALIEGVPSSQPGKEVEELAARNRLPKELGSLDEIRNAMAGNLAFSQMTNEIYQSAGQRL